jgi:hypothetical protein
LKVAYQSVIPSNAPLGELAYTMGKYNYGGPRYFELSPTADMKLADIIIEAINPNFDNTFLLPGTSSYSYFSGKYYRFVRGTCTTQKLTLYIDGTQIGVWDGKYYGSTEGGSYPWV